MNAHSPEPLGSDHIQSTFGISQVPLNVFLLFAIAINCDLELTHTDPFALVKSDSHSDSIMHT